MNNYRKFIPHIKREHFYLYGWIIPALFTCALLAVLALFVIGG